MDADESVLTPTKRTTNALIIRASFTITIALAALVLCLGLPVSDFAGWALLSVIVFHLSLRPTIREILITLVPASLFWISYALLFRHFQPTPVFVLATLGTGSFITLAARAVWFEGQERRRTLSVLFPASGLLIFLLAKQGLPDVPAMQKGTYDLYLLLVDGSFGFQPAYAVETFFRTHPIASLFIYIIYDALPVAMAIVYAVHMSKCNSRYYMLRLLIATVFLGWALYNVVPAVGPVYFLGRDFTGPLPSYSQLSHLGLEKIVMPASVYRNAMPSLHMTWALLLWWNSRKLGRITHLFAATFAFLTGLATLGTGEHYFIDLVVAFPFSLLIQCLCTRRSTDLRLRLVALSAGTVLTAAWLLIVRTDPKIFLASRWLPWLCTLVTLALVQILFYRLERAADPAVEEERREPSDVDFAHSGATR